MTVVPLPEIAPAVAAHWIAFPRLLPLAERAKGAPVVTVAVAGVTVSDADEPLDPLAVMLPLGVSVPGPKPQPLSDRANKSRRTHHRHNRPLRSCTIQTTPAAPFNFLLWGSS